MKNYDLNNSVEFRKILKSRNSGKIDELETRLNKLTNYTINKDLHNNKTYHNTSCENEILLTELINNRIKSEKKMHKKTMSNNFTKTIKFSTPKKAINGKEVMIKNKSINNNSLLKIKSALKNNKSINCIMGKVEARSNNVSPINTSFTKKKILDNNNTINKLYNPNILNETKPDSIIFTKNSLS